MNRKDPEGRNVFAGGFLGLDNIGVFDRSAKLPTGGYLDQADGTAWMAFYCQNMLEIAVILMDCRIPSGEEEACLFFLSTIRSAYAMGSMGEGQRMGTKRWASSATTAPPAGQVCKASKVAPGRPTVASAATVFEAGTVERHPRMLRPGTCRSQARHPHCCRLRNVDGLKWRAWRIISSFCPC